MAASAGPARSGCWSSSSSATEDCTLIIDRLWASTSCSSLAMDSRACVARRSCSDCASRAIAALRCRRASITARRCRIPSATATSTISHAAIAPMATAGGGSSPRTQRDQPHHRRPAQQRQRIGAPARAHRRRGQERHDQRREYRAEAETRRQVDHRDRDDDQQHRVGVDGAQQQCDGPGNQQQVAEPVQRHPVQIRSAAMPGPALPTSWIAATTSGISHTAGRRRS